MCMQRTGNTTSVFNTIYLLSNNNKEKSKSVLFKSESKGLQTDTTAVD